MKYKIFELFLLFLFFSTEAFSQNFEQKADDIQTKIEELDKKKEELLLQLYDIKLDVLFNALIRNGLPEISNPGDTVHHSLMVLSYNEKHEQANWVAHMISTDINKGVLTRTNDFRVDPKIKTGSSEERDFFLRILQEDSTFEYDGFGYDRGHLAPSADFRWCAKAMSESYYYSNMSPQVAEFNRQIWADLESMVREYVQENNRNVYVVTGPILQDDLPRIERGVNRLSIPREYFKVVIDIEDGQSSGIGFLIPNEECDYPVISYAVSIDSIEQRTGIDFFASLPDSLENKLETNFDIKHWQIEKKRVNEVPIHRNRLPKNCINTVQARSFYDSKAKVCGTVVEVHETKSGHYFINFDLDFPEQLFWCTIWKDNIVNFSYQPHEYLLNKRVCVEGIIKKKYGKPSMSIYNEKAITLYEEEMKKR
jgi:endonuclease G